MEAAFGSCPMKAILGLDLICVLGNAEIAYQAPKRGGTLYCHISGKGRIQISGEAVLFAISEIQE